MLHIQAQPDAPVACSLTEGREARMREFDELFGRMRSVTLRFPATEAARIEDLARREAECCPFLEQRVETVADEVLWTIAGSGVGAFVRGG